MGRPIRILQLVRTLEPGGLESVVVNLCKGLQARGHVCFPACIAEPGSWLDKCGADDSWAGRAGSGSRLSVILSLCRYVRSRRIDIIHSHNPPGQNVGVPVSILTGIPLVHTKHGRNWFKQPHQLFRNRCLSFFSRKIVAVSESVARAAIELERVPPEKVTVIVNGIDVPGADRASTASLRTKAGLPASAFVIGSVGRFDLAKNYPLLVCAFARFLEQAGRRGDEDGFKLLIVGDGSERGPIMQEVAAQRLEKQVVMPSMQDNIVPWLKCMDVFCLSSITEGTSIALLEAGACGTPSVVTPVGGNAEVVQDGRTGIVVKDGDVETISAALFKLWEDERMRRAMGDAAREWISDRYSLGTMLDRYEQVYAEVLGRGCESGF